MLILKIVRILNITLLTILLGLLLWFFIESYIYNTPEGYVFLFYPIIIEMLIPLFGIILLIINIKHRKKGTQISYFFIF